MTKTLLVATSFILVFSGTVEAGDYRGYRRDYQPPRHYQPAPPPRIVHHRTDWILPAAVLTLGGIAIGTAISQAPPPRPVHITPPPAPNWYYCRSSSQYYPYTNTCPEGWQAVPSR